MFRVKYYEVNDFKKKKATNKITLKIQKKITKALYKPKSIEITFIFLQVADMYYQQIIQGGAYNWLSSEPTIPRRAQTNGKRANQHPGQHETTRKREEQTIQPTH